MTNDTQNTQGKMVQASLPFPSAGEDYITIKELCLKLRVSRSLIYTLMKDKGTVKGLPKHKIGRALRFKFSEVSKHLEKLNRQVGC